MSESSEPMTSWWFASKGPADKERDPIQGEFFNQEGMSTASSIVRETIRIHSMQSRRTPPDRFGFESSPLGPTELYRRRRLNLLWAVCGITY